MYDYVIVGAGSAGCVLAHRLSEDPDVRVLVIEAGGADRSELIHMPATATAQLQTDKDWDYSSGYEPHFNNRRIYLPRGRVLGGSSSLNWMTYMRGHPLDYDEWRDLGCPGWGWDEMLPYFMRAEDNDRGPSQFHGAGGPLGVSDGRSRNPIAQAFIEAGVAYGLAPNEDFNAGVQDGVGWFQVTERDGRRSSTAAGYLRPAMERPNVEVETYAHVVKVLFDGDRAIGVQALRLGELVEFRAEAEVILSAGAYNSPQLLMLSGIGRPQQLAALGIETVVELPGVGQNLLDHPVAYAVYESARKGSLFGAMNDANIALYENERRGPLTSNGPEAGGFARTREGLDVPDVQLHFIPALIVDEGLVPGDRHGLSLAVNVGKAQSRGYLELISPDPTAKPLIVHNYCADPEDLRALIGGLRICMEIAATEPLAGWVGASYRVPGSASDEDMTAFIRAHGQGGYHPAGTCKMGVDELAVVDPQLRVRGVEALRVVDASIMPTIPRGNTNAPTIAIGEKGADLIRGRSAAPASAGAAAAS